MHRRRLIVAVCLFALFLGVTLSQAAPTPAASAPAQLTAATTLGGSSMAVAANANVAVVGDGQGIVVYDIRGAAPVGVSRLALPGFVQALTIAANRLFIGADNTVLAYELVGVTPRLLSRFQAAGAVRDLVAADNRLYVATAAGLEILDVRDPAAPTRLGTLPRTYGLTRLLAEGATLYAVGRAEEPVFTHIGSLLQIDVTDPAAPAVRNESTLLGSMIAVEAGLARHGDTIFVIGDISGPRGVGQMSFEIWPFDAATLEGAIYQGFGATLTNENATALVAYGENLLALSTTGGLSVINPADPADLQRVAQLNLGFYRTDLAIVGERAFAALYNGGLQVIDLSAPTAPTTGAPQRLLGPTSNAAAFGDALLTVSAAGDTPGQTLSSFDLRALNAPRLGDQVTIDGAAQIDLDPGTAGIHLLYDGNTDLTRFVDAREPGELRLSGELRLGPSNAIAVQGTRAYIGITGPTGATPELAVFDISDFAEPREIGRLELPSAATELVVVDERLYLLDSLQNLVLYSLANPANPSKLGEIAINERYTRMAVSGETVYVGLTDGVQIVDARNPAAPVLGVQFAAGVPYPQLAASEGRLALTGEFNGAEPGALQVYTLADPLAPELLAETALPPTTNGFNRLTGAQGRFTLSRGIRGVSIYSILNNTAWLPLIGG